MNRRPLLFATLHAVTILCRRSSLARLLRGIPSNRIVGGGKAPIGKYPWMAAILDNFDGDRQDAYTKHRCGATLISPNWVVTAAHCVQGTGNLHPSVLIGTSSLIEWRTEKYTVENVTHRPEWRLIDEIHAYPQVWRTPGDVYYPDVAMLHLATPSTLPHLELPKTPPQAGETTLTMGWGSVHRRNPEYPQVLHDVSFRVISDEVCNASYVAISGGSVTINSKFECCAGDPAGGRDSCFGDSGGPMVRETKMKNGRTSHGMVGIVSYGVVPCGARGTYGVYVDAYSVLPFVKAIIANQTYDHLQGRYFEHAPTSMPTSLSTSLPTDLPTPLPSVLPTPLPSPVPSPLPSALPTPLPSVLPTPLPQVLPITVSNGISRSPSYVPTTSSPTFIEFDSIIDDMLESTYAPTPAEEFARLPTMPLSDENTTWLRENSSLVMYDVEDPSIVDDSANETTIPPTFIFMNDLPHNNRSDTSPTSTPMQSIADASLREDNPPTTSPTREGLQYTLRDETMTTTLLDDYTPSPSSYIPGPTPVIETYEMDRTRLHLPRATPRPSTSVPSSSND